MYHWITIALCLINSYITWVRALWLTYPQISPPTLIDWGSDKRPGGHIEMQNCIQNIKNTSLVNIKYQNTGILFHFFLVPYLILFSTENGKIFIWSYMVRVKKFSMEIFFEINSAMSPEHKNANFDVAIAKKLVWEMKQMVSIFPGRPVLAVLFFSIRRYFWVYMEFNPELRIENSWIICYQQFINGFRS